MFQGCCLNNAWTTLLTLSNSCWTNNIVEHCSQKLLQFPSRGWQWDRNHAFTGKIFVCYMVLWWSVWYLPVIWYCDGQYDICLWYGIVMVSMVFVCDMVFWWSVWYLSVIWYCDGQYEIFLWYGIVMAWYLYVIWHSDGMIFVCDMV